MNIRYFEDFVVGKVIELGEYPPVSEEEIIAFARQWDPQPMHLDPVRAQDSMFGGLIASGWHTGAIAMRLLVDGMVAGSHGEGSPGVEVRWLRPVRPGDRLSGRYTVLEAAPSRSRPSIGKLKGRTELRNQEGELVLVMDATGFMRRRVHLEEGAGG